MISFVRLLLLSFLVAATQAVSTRLRFQSGLDNDDIIEWSGTVSNKRSMATLVIQPRMANSRTKHFRMEIHGFRNRVLINNKPTNIIMKYRICFLGKTLIRPLIKFNFQVRVNNRLYKVYLNNKLIFSLPNSVTPSDIRNVQVFGSAKTATLKKLEISDFASRLNTEGCGRSADVPNGNTFQAQCDVIHNNNRIVNGRVSWPGSLPWQVSIRRKAQYANSDMPHQCGATLINECWAISAGHCFPVTHSSALRKLVLRVGDYFNDDSDADNNNRFRDVEDSQDLGISKVYKHEMYQSIPTARNDIALIKLSTCARIGPLVKPVCMPTSEDQFQAGARCSIAGWGASEWAQTQANHPKCLMIGDVRIHPIQECTKTFANKEYDNNIMFCAAGDVGDSSSSESVDACQGDSGGPFVCHNENVSTLFGITSWGIKCGDKKYPGVYTRLSTFMKWVYLKIKLTPNDDNLRRAISKKEIASEYCQHKKQK